MRIRTTLLTGALLLASTFAMAQQTPQTKPQQGPSADAVVAPSDGTFDFGFRGGSFDGDAARFGRYQDYRDGQAGLNFKWKREASNWFADVHAFNVGYLDQAFDGKFVNSKVKASFEWNQMPLYYGSGDILKSPYSLDSVSNHVATLTLDQATRDRVQAGTTYTYDKNGVITGATQSNSAIGMVTAPNLNATGTVWRNLLGGNDLRSRRDNVKADLTYAASRDVDLKFSLNSYNRNGSQPWGASFGFNDAVELALPIDNRTTNLNADAEWANQKGMFKIGYDGSFFDNNITTLVWSNPVRATDSWNSSSYSNSLLGGAALGRMSLSPNNHANTVTATGLYKLPARSSVNASLAVSSLSQNDQLLPFTINSTLQPGTPVTVYTNNVPSTWTMVAPERTTAETNVRLTVGTFNFTSRPNRYFGLFAKYRYSNWNNKTPLFENQFNVRFDGTPENVPGSETEPGNIQNQTFDVDASITPISYGAFKVGYGHASSDLTYRMFSGYGENTFRVAFDTIGNQYVTLRAKYENASRTSRDIGTLTTRDGTEGYYNATGQHPGMAQFDVASRDRSRTTLVFDVSPVPIVGLSMSVFKGKDDYPGIQYGLLSNDNTGVNVAVDLMPSNFVTVGFNYGYEKYDALQASKAAQPAPSSTWTDPAYDWNLNNNERVDEYGFSVELAKLIPKTEIRFGYDYNKSDQAFIYGGPRPAALATIPSAFPAQAPGTQFQPLPNVTGKLQNASVDVKYFISPKIAIGGNFLHQKFDISDWQTPGTVSNPYDPLGGLVLSYGWRPYDVNVGGFRVIYLF